MNTADMIEAMRAEGVPADTILSVVARIDSMKADRVREQTRDRVRRFREKSNENSQDVTLVTVTDVTSVTSVTTPPPPPSSPFSPTPPITPPSTSPTPQQPNADARRVEVAFQQFVAAANRQPAWPVPKALNSSRRNKLAARVKEHGLEEWGRAIERAERSAFLTGQTNRPFAVSLDWLLEPRNLQKVMEGNYDDRTAKIHAINGGRAEGRSANSGGGLGAFDRLAERLAASAGGNDAGRNDERGGADEGVIDAEFTWAAG